MDEKRKRFLEMEFSPHEDALKIAEITKYLQYINLVYKAVAGFEYFDSDFERCFTVTKMLTNSITCYREIIYKRKSQLVQTSLSCFKIYKWKEKFYFIL